MSLSISMSVRQSDLPEFLDAVELNLWFTAKEFYFELAQLLQSKWFIVEVRVWKKPTMLVYESKEDNYLFSIYSDTGEIWLNKKSKTWTFDRVSFFKQLFDYNLDPQATQNQFKIWFEQYKDRFSEIITNLSLIHNSK